MKSLNIVSSTSLGRILLHLACGMRRPSHWRWHWQGIQRELSLAFGPTGREVAFWNFIQKMLRAATGIGSNLFAWTCWVQAAFAPAAVQYAGAPSSRNKAFKCLPLLLASTLLSLAPRSALGQTCANALNGGPFISPISGSRVVAGQVITITRFSVGSANGGCGFQNGTAYYAAPDGTVSQVLSNFTLMPGGEIDCNGTPGSNNVSCLAFTTYVVNPADAGRTLILPLPPTNEFDGTIQTYPGVANEIHFFSAVGADGFDPNDPSIGTGPAAGTGTQRLILVHPGISLSRICDINGSFQGSLCNTGDVTLVNINISDGLPGSITLATNTSSGRIFNGFLTNRECVDYFGSYGSSNAVVASGTASGVYPAMTLYATNSEYCGAPFFDPGSPGFSSTNGFHAVVCGPTGATLEIQTSTNSLTWSPWLVLSNFPGRMACDDPSATNMPLRFYRAMAR